jgi:hypothetical protein
VREPARHLPTTISRDGRGLLDTGPISPLFDGLEIRGIIGTRLLMHFLATIDYPDGALILQRTTSANLQSHESQVTANGVKVIPFWLVETNQLPQVTLCPACPQPISPRFWRSPSLLVDP